MREYKFRGKRLDNGEWVAGHYLTRRTQDEGVQHMISYQDMWGFHEVDPATVGQYVFDNKYTGDIFAVVCDCDSEYGCSHKTEHWELVFHDRYLQYGFKRGDRFVLLDEFGEENIHHIGNRLDNPELLEG